MQKSENEKVLEVCKKYGSSVTDNTGDLWIQGLTYFRDLEGPDSEKYLQEALEFIGEKGLLSPLLILEII
jgi:hypothetical protein